MSFQQGKKVLVTGGAGYIGSKLVSRLLDLNYKVTVLDSLFFGDESLSPFYNLPNFRLIQADIKDSDTIYQTLQGMETVIHLAANVTVSGSESVAEAKSIQEINYLATCNFVDLCKEWRVERFIFTSSCSNYGISDVTKDATEEDVLKPTSPYAKSKVMAEEYILSSKNAHFHPCILRLATVFGLSPRMSFQPLFNALVRDAVIKKSLLIYGAQSWRPFVHIDDVVQAFLLVLRAPLDSVSGQVFNVGSNSLNYQKIQLVNLIKKVLPQTEIEIKEDATDPRSYKVSFDKIATALGFKATKTTEEGIVEIKEVLEKHSCE